MSSPHVYTPQDFENSVHYWKELCKLHEAESKRLEQDLARTREKLANYETDAPRVKMLEDTVDLYKQQLSTAKNELEITRTDMAKNLAHVLNQLDIAREQLEEAWAEKRMWFKIADDNSYALQIAREALEDVLRHANLEHPAYDLKLIVTEALAKLAQHTQSNTPMPMGESSGADMASKEG